MKLLRAILMVFLGLFMSSEVSGAKEPEIGMVLCRESNDPPSKWERDVTLSAGRALILSGVKSIGVRRDPCTEIMPDATCFAGPRVLLCRTTAIERVLKASAWMIAAYVRTGEKEYEDFRRIRRRAVVEAFAYADGGATDPELEKLIESILVMETPDGTALQKHAISEKEALAALYQYLADINLAVILGHESFHVFDDSCPIEEKSVAESTGLFDKAVEVHMKSSLFCPRAPSVAEIKADHCALRYLHKLSQRNGEDQGSDSVAFSFARRAAADIVTYQILTGWRQVPEIPRGKFVLVSMKQYLYEPLRALLMANEIHGNRPGPAICGDASSLWVHGVQEAVKGCGKDAGGIVPDEFLAKLPRGVEDSWNGKPWTDESYSCRASASSTTAAPPKQVQRIHFGSVVSGIEGR